jgi:hypothetical protein
MEYTPLKHIFDHCPELAGLSEEMKARLWARGRNVIHPAQMVIYAEGTLMDNTFCLLLSGKVKVKRAGKLIGPIHEGYLFGELAYITKNKTRTATVYVVDGQAEILVFDITNNELQSSKYAELHSLLTELAWDKFRSDT